MERRQPSGELAFVWPVARAPRLVAIERVGRALAAPPLPRHLRWAEGVHGALVELRADLRAADAVDERGDALNLAVMGATPRLATAIGRLGRERVRVVAMVDQLLRDVSATHLADDVHVIRDRGTALLQQLQQHRQRGSDLLHEAHLEMGGES